MSWLDYVIQPENIYTEFGTSQERGTKHPKYEQACALLSQLAGLNNLGALVIENPKYQGDEQQLNDTQLNKNAYKEGSFEFGPSTPQSPGYYLNEEETTVLDNNLADLGNKYINESDDLSDGCVCEEKRISADKHICSTYAKSEFEISRFLISQRSSVDGLPSESFFIKNKSSFSKNIHFQKATRILDVISKLIKLVFISETEIETRTHSAVRHLIFLYLVEPSNSYFDSSFATGESASPNVNKRKSPVLRPASPYITPDEGQSEVEYSRLLYHRWVLRSYYREKSLKFHHDKKFLDTSFTNTLSVSYKKLLEFLTSELVTTFHQTEHDIALHYYDLARFKFALRSFEDALSHFQMSVQLYPLLSKQNGQKLARISGEEGTVSDFISACQSLSKSSSTLSSNGGLLDSSNHTPSVDRTSAKKRLSKLKSKRAEYSTIVLQNTEFDLNDIILVEIGIPSRQNTSNGYVSDLGIQDGEDLCKISSEVLNLVDPFRVSVFLEGLSKENGVKISFYSWVLSMFTRAMGNLLEDNYLISATWFEYISNQDSITVSTPDFIVGSVNSKISQLSAVASVLAQSKAYTHLSKALYLLGSVSSNTDSDENTVLQEITSHVTTALDYKFQPKDSDANKISNTPLKFLVLEKIALKAMRLGLQKLFVTIVERVAIHPQLYQQMPDKNMSILNIASGLFYLKTLLSQSNVMQFRHISELEANINNIYNDSLYFKLPKPVLTDIRTHFFRALNSLILLSNRNSNFYTEFDELFNSINNPNICLMLAGFISGTLLSLLIEEKHTYIPSLESYGILSYSFFSKSAIEGKLGLRLLSSEYRLFLLQNSPPATSDIQFPEHFGVTSDLNDSDTLADLSVESNLEISVKARFYIELLARLNKQILKVYPQCKPTILSVCDISYFLSKISNNCEKPNALNSTKALRSRSISDNNQLNSSKQHSTGTNPSKPPNAFLPLNPSQKGQKGQQVSNDSVSNMFIDLSFFSHSQSFARNFVDYICYVSDNFDPVSLMAIFIPDDSVYDLNGISGFNYYTSTASSCLPLSSIPVFINDFKSSHKSEISLIRDRIGAFISLLLDLKLFVGAAALFQYLPAEAEFTKTNSQNEKSDYLHIFNAARSAVNLEQFNLETSQFFWDLTICQQVQYYLNKKARQDNITELHGNNLEKGHLNGIKSFPTSNTAHVEKSTLSAKSPNLETLQGQTFNCSESLYKTKNRPSFNSFRMDKLYVSFNERLLGNSKLAYQTNPVDLDFNCLNLPQDTNYTHHLFELQQQLDHENILSYKLFAINKLFVWISFQL